MTDQNQGIVPTEDQVTDFLSPNTFVTFLSTVTKDTLDPKDTYLRIVIDREETFFIDLTSNQSNNRLFTDETINKLTLQYIKMFQLLGIMIKHKFTLEILEIVASKGSNGVRFEFLTPEGRKQTSYYSGHDIEHLIPDDFLRELELFPSRHG